MRGNPKNKASLRISSQITTAREISDALDFDPDSFLEKDSRAVPKDPKSYVFPSHMWSIKSDLDETESLETHITRIIEFIENRETVFKELIKTCEFDIFCGYFSNQHVGNNISLSPDLL